MRDNKYLKVEVMPEQQTSSLTAKSRRFKEGRLGTGKFSTPDSHVDEENGAKIIVYNTKNDSKKGDREKNTEKKREQKVEEIQQ